MLTIKGTVIAKKNSKQIVPVRGRYIIVASEAFKKWNRDAQSQVRASGHDPVPTPCRITATFYSLTARRFDVSNSWESIGDLLVDCGIIPDDSVLEIPELVLRYGGKDKENPRVEIEFSSIT